MLLLMSYSLAALRPQMCGENDLRQQRSRIPPLLRPCQAREIVHLQPLAVKEQGVQAPPFLLKVLRLEPAFVHKLLAGLVCRLLTSQGLVQLLGGLPHGLGTVIGGPHQRCLDSFLLVF